MTSRKVRENENAFKNIWEINFNPLALKYYLILHFGFYYMQIEIPKSLYDELKENDRNNN